MTAPANRTLLVVGQLLVTLSLVTGSAVASTSSLHEPAGIFRYQMTAMGTLGGEAVLTVEEATKIGEGAARRIRLEVRTSGVAGRVFRAEGDGTTVVDEAFNPLRMKWSSTTRGKRREAKLALHSKGVQGRYRHKDNVLHKVDITTKSWPLDAISAYLWLPQQPLKAGTTYARTFFDGRRIGTLRATVGVARSIQVPVGLRDVVPMTIVAGRAGREKDVTFWIGVTDRVLYRIEVSHGILGMVRADLTGAQRPDKALGRGEEARE
ncbi:MAG: DUF3108 domain-containing protein [Myxococcota bacterium]